MTLSGDSGAPYYVNIENETKVLGIHTGLIKKSNGDIQLDSSLIEASLCWLNNTLDEKLVAGEFCEKEELMEYACYSIKNEYKQMVCLEQITNMQEFNNIEVNECRLLHDEDERFNCLRNLAG